MNQSTHQYPTMADVQSGSVQVVDITSSSKKVEPTLATRAVDYTREKLGDGILIVCFLVGALTIFLGDMVAKKIKRIKRVWQDESSIRNFDRDG